MRRRSRPMLTSAVHPRVIRTITSLVANVVLMFTVWLFNGWIPSFRCIRG
jgi:hypothetical protein